MKKSEYYLRELKKDLSRGLSKLKDPSRNAPARLGAVRFYMEGAEANLQAYEEALEEERYIREETERDPIPEVHESQSISDETPVQCSPAEAL